MEQGRSCLAASLACLFACTSAHAQSPSDARGYPGRPIRIIVANTAGSAMDNVTRMIGQRLTEAWGKALSDSPVAQRLTQLGLDPAPSTPAELTAYLKAETERYGRIVKQAGLKGDN